MRILLLIFVAAGCGPALAGEDAVARAIADLGSPFADRREDAMAALAAGLPGAAAALREAYGRADFEVRTLILGVFARGGAREGIPLLTGDVGTPDRGVALAQRRLAGALFLRARDAVRNGIGTLVDDGDWRSEEALRSLPGRAGSARAALRRAREAGGRRGAAAERVEAAVAEVDGLRAALKARRGEGDAGVADGAREIDRYLVRHETERALRAVLEAGGRSGSYDGMYGLLRELAEMDRATVCGTLLAMVTGSSPGESGVPGARDGGSFLERDILDDTELRERAAACLGEVGGPAEAEELGEYYERIRDQEPSRYDDTRWPVALSLAALGVRDPLRGLVGQYSERLGFYGEDPFGDGVGGRALRAFIAGWIHEDLAAAWSRLGDLRRAERHLRESLRDEDRPVVRLYNYACLLARMGKVEEGLAALRGAVEGGYALDPSNVRWMERDGDLEALRRTEGYARLREEIRAGRHAVPR